MNYSALYESILKAHAFLPYYFDKKAFAPIRVQLELTGRCMLNCAFCYQGKDYKDGRDELGLKEITAIIDQIPKYSLLTLSGGEPLMKEGIKDILEHALKRHYCNIITNGVLLTEDVSKILVDRKLTLLNISIDGLGKAHDDLRGAPGIFQKIKENILFLQSYKQKKKKRFPLIDIKTVINAKNIGELEGLYDFCEELGVDFFTLSLMKNNNLQFNGTKLYDDLHNEVFYKCYQAGSELDVNTLANVFDRLSRKKGKARVRFYPRLTDHGLLLDYLDLPGGRKGLVYLPCLEPWSGLQINAQGKAYPCLSYCVGDIRKNSLKEIWNSSKFLEFREILKKFNLFPACAGCCYLKIRRKK